MRGFSGFNMIVATIFSTIIHFFVLILFDTIPLIPKEITPQADIYMVELMPVEIERSAPRKEEETAVQQKVEEAKKEEPKKETVKQEKKRDTVVLEDRSKEKAKKENKEKPTVNDEQQRLAAIKKIKQKVAGRNTDDAPMVTDAEIQKYPMMVENRVKGFWVIPDPLSARGLKAVVIFEIDKKGEAINLRLKQSSGNPPYDQSVIRAIRKAAPFSPPPQILLEEEYELTFQP
jgi:colicin import membrane protein